MHCLAVFKLVPANCSHPTNLSVIPQRFRCVLRVPLPCGQTKSALIYRTPARGTQSVLLHTGHPQKLTGIQYVKVDCVHPLRGGGKEFVAERSEARNSRRGQLCMSHQSRYTPSPLGLCRTKTFRWIVFVRGKVARGRMRGHKGTVASHQCLSVIPQRFRCVLRVSLPCGQTKSALIHWTSAKG